MRNKFQTVCRSGMIAKNKRNSKNLLQGVSIMERPDSQVIATISLRLKQLRLKAGLTQQGIAAKIGVSQQTYSNYESKCMSIDVGTLLQLCDFYKVSADYIIGRSDQENIPATPNSYMMPAYRQMPAYGMPVYPYGAAGYQNEDDEKYNKLFEEFVSFCKEKNI